MNDNAADSISHIDVGEVYSKTGLLGTNDATLNEARQRPECPPGDLPNFDRAVGVDSAESHLQLVGWRSPVQYRRPNDDETGIAPKYGTSLTATERAGGLVLDFFDK